MDFTRSVIILMYSALIRKEWIHYHRLERLFEENQSCNKISYPYPNVTVDGIVPVLSINLTDNLVTLETNSLRANWTVKQYEGKHFVTAVSRDVSMVIKISFVQRGESPIMHEKISINSEQVATIDDLNQFVFININGLFNENVQYFTHVVDVKRNTMDNNEDKSSNWSIHQIHECNWIEFSESSNVIIFVILWVTITGVICISCVFLKHKFSESTTGPVGPYFE